MKNLAVRYKELSTQEKAAYDQKAEKLREVYHQRKKEYM